VKEPKSRKKSGKQRNQLGNVKLETLNYEPEINDNPLSALKHLNPDKKKLKPIEL